MIFLWILPLLYKHIAYGLGWLLRAIYTVHYPQNQKSNDHGLKTSDFRDRSLIQVYKTGYSLTVCYYNSSSQNYVRKTVS